MKSAEQSTAVIKLHSTTTRDRSTSSSQDHRVNIVVGESPSLHLRRKIPASTRRRISTSAPSSSTQHRVSSSSPRRRKIFITSSSRHLRRRVNHGTGVTGTPNCSCRAQTLYSLAARSGLRVSVILLHATDVDKNWSHRKSMHRTTT